MKLHFLSVKTANINKKFVATTHVFMIRYAGI